MMAGYDLDDMYDLSIDDLYYLSVDDLSDVLYTLSRVP